MKINRTKQKLLNGEVAFGCAIQQYGSIEVPRAFAAAGFDYAFIDMEHGTFDLESASRLVRASLDHGITPIVRVGELLYSLVARLLDNGAQGIIFPRVEEPERLHEALSWTKFPPLGVRGYGLGAPQLDYEPRTFREVIEHANTNILTVVQFETVLAIERREDLLSIPGIDVMMVGPADLSVSLGVPGEFEHPLLVEAVMKLIESCRKHGVAPGIQCRTVDMSRKWVERGMQFVGAGADHGLLLEGAKKSMAELTAAARAKSAPAS